jgi:hypothetical protein
LRGLAHLYVLCKGGDGEVGPDSFSLKRAQRESTSSEAKAPGRQRHESPPLPKTAKCQPPQSRSAGLGARAGAVAVEQLSELCFGRGGHGANQSVGRDKDKSPGVGSMSPHLYKERKGGPAPDNAARLSEAGAFGIWSNLVLSEGQALANEYGAATSGQCD